jgi:RecB family endonuclease NucS
MPNRITEIEIKEKNVLEPMLVQDLEQIEQGLKFIGRQLPTVSGPLDILAVDSDGALVIIELKSVIDEGQLI